jgi:crotonobetainyl-CoA:carnitine CoA-transferase CaiB-like acyl-CoA transferase
MAKALDGVRIVDTTEGAQGPWAAALLADLGADVIKIEKPEGEMMRNGGPTKNGHALPNAGMNHGKRNIVLNLKEPEDRQILLRLVRRADVFMENWRPGVADRLGVGYDVLSKINPRLIYASASGFGQRGTYAGKATVDPISQAMGGYFSLTGPRGGPGEKPRFIVIDFTSPLVFAQSVLLGLLSRDETNGGQWVECSQLETMVSIGSVRAAEYFATGRAPQPWGSASPYAVPCQAFQTADTYILVDCRDESDWRALCETLDLLSLVSDPRFGSNALRVEHRDTLIPILERAFLRYRGERWLQKLERAGVPCGPVAWDIEDLHDDAQVQANGLLVDRQHPAIGRVRTNEVPWKLSRTPAEYGPLAPLMDQDRAGILAELDKVDAAPAG